MLSVDGGALVTLKEGGSVGKLQLVRILRDRVHVQLHDRMWSVRAVD
jgi:hypothetical protein